jgi:hypothetical protein
MKILRYMFLMLMVICFHREVFAQSDTGANPFINDSNGRPLYMKPRLDRIIITGINSAVNVKGAAIGMVCADGKLKLVRKINITYKDMQEYGNTNITRTFTRKEYFEYIRGDHSGEKLPKSPDAIVMLMNDRKHDIQQLLTLEKLDLRKDNDIIRLFQFYNKPVSSK